MIKKKIKGYPLDEKQIVFLRQLKLSKEYKKVLPDYKSMVTISINNKKIINDKHLNGVRQAIKTIDDELVKHFNLPVLNKKRTKIKTKKRTKIKTKKKSIIKYKTRPFKEVYIKDELLTNTENHRKYLKSGKWKRKRIYLLKKRGSKCENCGHKPKHEYELHIHHRTYRRWGRETEGHLKILCKPCHNKLHDKFTNSELEDFFSKKIDPKI